MENASKALIIAGAILLAILIIGLGVFIYNQASNTVSDTGMDQIAVRQFNAQFEPYIMDNASGATAMALYDTVNSYNMTAQDGKKINLILSDGAAKKTGAELKKMSFIENETDVKVIKIMECSNCGQTIEGIRFQKSELSSLKRYNIYVSEYDGGVIKTIVIARV